LWPNQGIIKHHLPRLPEETIKNLSDVTSHPHPARKLSANLYDIYRCCVYSEKLLMMDRGTVRNM